MTKEDEIGRFCHNTELVFGIKYILITLFDQLI
jgi:hypothetical protein